MNYVVYYTYFKKSDVLKQAEKEKVYIDMLKKISIRLDDDIVILFDAFHKPDFDEKIKSTISKFSNVKSIEGGESYIEEGLQFVDNICSSVRRYLNNPKDVYYQLIKAHSKMLNKWIHFYLRCAIL